MTYLLRHEAREVCDSINFNRELGTSLMQVHQLKRNPEYASIARKRVRAHWTRWPVMDYANAGAKGELLEELEAECEYILKDDVQVEKAGLVAMMKELEGVMRHIAQSSGAPGYARTTIKKLPPLNYQHVLQSISLSSTLSEPAFEELTSKCDALFGGNTQIRKSS